MATSIEIQPLVFYSSLIDPCESKKSLIIVVLRYLTINSSIVVVVIYYYYYYIRTEPCFRLFRSETYIIQVLTWVYI